MLLFTMLSIAQVPGDGLELSVLSAFKCSRNIMAESITCQRGLITAGGDKEPGGGGQAVRSGVRGTGSSLFLRPRAAAFSRLMPMKDGSRRLQTAFVCCSGQRQEVPILRDSQEGEMMLMLVRVPVPVRVLEIPVQGSGKGTLPGALAARPAEQAQQRWDRRVSAGRRAVLARQGPAITHSIVEGTRVSQTFPHEQSLSSGIPTLRDALPAARLPPALLKEKPSLKGIFNITLHPFCSQAAIADAGVSLDEVRSFIGGTLPQ
ncbi:PREDICTED: uncharacterized protein LOC104285184 [Charadrius vociferus]|uniref:uncharacterized protein LOC104285184 n=1 Tax=Charadrius vociferus TaxID=50402 RepID=UPI00052131F8|nr:PREDICTED: uncharacterized protein LOC104285184 [Charadrius vociferus]